MTTHIMTGNDFPTLIKQHFLRPKETLMLNLCDSFTFLILQKGHLITHHLSIITQYRVFYIVYLMSDHVPQHSEIDVNRYLKYMGIVSVAIALSNPIELVKTRLQISPELIVKKTITVPYSTVTNTFQRVVK